MKYSKELVKRYKQYMDENYCAVVLYKDAQLYLKSLSYLFTTFAKIEQKKSK